MADGKVVIDVELNDKGATGALDDLDKKTSGLEDSGSKGAMGIGKIVTALGLVKVASAVFGLIKDSIGKAFSRIDTMEQFERVMTTMTGSTEKANEVLDTTNDIVVGTAYGLDVAAQSVQNFVTSNMDVDQATATVAAWGDAVAFYGDGSNETFASVTDAIAKMSAKGKVSMEEVNRMTERGIPALQIYADKTGLSVEQISSEISKGNIKSEDFIETMNDALMNGTENFGAIEGAAKEAGASWGASFDNMGAAVARGVISIIESIDQMLVDNGLPEMCEMVASFGSKVEEVLKSAAEKVVPFVEGLVWMYETFGNLLVPLGFFLALFITYQTVMSIVNTVTSIATSVQAAYNAVLMANPIGIVVALIVMLVGAFIYLWNTNEGFRNFWINMWNTITSALSTAWFFIKLTLFLIGNFFKAVGTAIVASANSVKSGTVNAWNSMKTSVVNLANGLKDGAIRAWNTLKSATSTAFEAVVGFIKSPLEGVDLFSIGKDIIQGLVNGIKSMAGAVKNAVTDVATGIKDKIKGALNINSPSRWMRDEIGKMIPQGIAVGIEADTKKATGAMTNMTKTLMPKFNANTALGGTRSLGLGGGGSSVVNNYHNSNNGGLAELLQQALNRESVIVLDDGTLVGKTAQKYDGALGQIAQSKGRWTM